MGEAGGPDVPGRSGLGEAEDAGATGRAGGSAGRCSAGTVGLPPKSFFRRFRAESGISLDLECAASVT